MSGTTTNTDNDQIDETKKDEPKASIKTTTTEKKQINYGDKLLYHRISVKLLNKGKTCVDTKQKK